MSATFACPHCGATYPVKPVLVGKPVRCTKCKNAFKLRPDGVADKVEMEAPAPAAPAPAAQAVPDAAPPATAPPITSPPPPRPTPPPEPAAAPRPPARPAAPSTPPPARMPTPAPAPTGASDRAPAQTGARTSDKSRLNLKQEEARRAMAGTLATAAAAALQAEAVKRESAKEEKVKKASPGASGRTAAQGGPRIGPVLVVGEGEKQAKNSRLLILVTLALIGGIAAIVALSALRSPQRKALEAFAAPVDERYARYPNRLPRIQARAWLSSGPALVDLGSVHVGSTTRHALANARPVITAIAKDQTYLQQYDLWAPAADAGKIAKAWSPKKNRDANLEALKAANLATTTREELEAKLQGAGLTPDGVAVLMQLLLPTQGAPQDAAQRVGKGELPDAIEISTFRGRKGTALQDAGNKYSYPTTDYSGKLLRFIGDGWPQEWRVLEVDFVR